MLQIVYRLEVALFTLQVTQKPPPGYREPSARRRGLEPHQRLAALLAGLCHDPGKPIIDPRVTTANGFTWNFALTPTYRIRCNGTRAGKIRWVA